MKQIQEAVLLRIFISEDDHFHGKPLYEVIVSKAHELGLAGATVLRGIMGYGAGSKIHTAKILRLSEDLPVVVEIVDIKENIDKILPFLDDAIHDGLVTIENVRIWKYFSQENANF